MLAREDRAGDAEVVVEAGAGVTPERHHALATPLPHDPDAVGVEVEIGLAERHHLRDPEPRAVEQLEQCAVTPAARRVGRRRVEQRLHVGAIGRERQRGRQPAHRELGRG